ncbi:MAG: sulfatase-like hydrolase/transferase [Bacillota bacterium]|nr:sulfatase-like hydrolase/transferase [Bacillota bacterium]
MKRASSRDLREFKKNKPTSKIITFSRKLFIVLIFVLFFIGLLGFTGAKWYHKYYSDVSIGQLLFHIYAPMDGADTGFIQTFIPECLPIPAIGLLIFSILYLINKKVFKGIVSILVSCLLVIASLGTFVFGAKELSESMHLQSYIESVTTTSNIYEDKYVDPKEVKFTFPTEKRNLIYIFLESMETTYEGKKDGGLTSTDYIPELTKLQNENDTFNGGLAENNGYYVPSSSAWTVAGIVGQTCGTPLTVDSSLSNNITEGDFLPNATSIGDVLKQAGYTNEFMCGSDIAFGGRENYLKQHGDYKFFDLKYARENGYIEPDYSVWWGFEDEKLFDFAKSELDTLSSQEEPFNFTLLTVDSHFPNGYTCKDCKDTYDENYSNVLNCSSKKIDSFISWCKEQPWYENTTIVLAGDHKTMDTNWFQNKDTAGYNRKAYYTIINSAQEMQRKDARQVCTYDFFPTTLASLGIRFDSDRLAFGTNLYGTADTICEEMGFATFNDKISVRSDYYINYLFGGRDVSKPAVSEEPNETVEPALPEFFEGEYDYHTGITTNNGQQIGGGTHQYVPPKPQKPKPEEGDGSNKPGDSGDTTDSDTGGGDSTGGDGSGEDVVPDTPGDSGEGSGGTESGDSSDGGNVSPPASEVTPPSVEPIPSVE